MLDMKICSDGFNGEWKSHLRKILSAAVIDPNCDEEICAEIGYHYQHYAPASLYKYYSDANPFHFKALKSNKMWYSSAINFNDVFDCDVIVDEVSVFQSIVDAVSKHTSVKKGGRIWLDCRNESRKATQKFELIFEKMKSETGIACLSESDSSLLMWSHYANNHKGFCVEYELLEINNQLGFTPVPVIYSNEKTVVQSVLPSPTKEKVIGLVFDGLTTKSPEWSYEREWRIIKDCNACGDKWDKEKHGALLPMIKPKSIILGCESTSAFQLMIQEFCNENRINLYKMEKDNKLYKLNKKVVLSFDT